MYVNSTLLSLIPNVLKYAVNDGTVHGIEKQF